MYKFPLNCVKIFDLLRFMLKVNRNINSAQNLVLSKVTASTSMMLCDLLQRQFLRRVPVGFWPFSGDKFDLLWVSFKWSYPNSVLHFH